MTKANLFLVLFIGVFTIKVSGQDTNSQRQTKVSIAEVSKVLSVKKSKAKEILEAINFNSIPIQEIFQNKDLKSDERRKRLMTLYSERQLKIRTLLTKAQQEKLDILFLKEKERHRNKHENIEKVQKEKLRKRAKDI